MHKSSKKEAEKQIEDFFLSIENKTTKEIKIIQNLSKNHNIKLGSRKKYFCKKCLNPYRNPKVRIRNGIKLVECEKCGYKSGWKIKLS